MPPLRDRASNVRTAAAQRRVPREFQQSRKFDPVTKQLAEVSFSLPGPTPEEQDYRDEIKRVTDITIPEDREVILTGVRTWTMPGEVRDFHHLTFKIVDRTAISTPEDVAALVKIADTAFRARKPLKKTAAAATRTRLVGLSDEQIGKVDQRGGTDAFWQRLGDLLGQLDLAMKEHPCEDAVIALGGDIIEGFENYKGQAHLNDLAHPSQMREARAYLKKAISTIAARHDHTTVLAVPSNHTGWRDGKDYLGKPGDDYGLELVDQVADVFAQGNWADRVDFLFPRNEWQVALALPVRDDVIGLTHGHVGKTFTPEGFRKWFLEQVAGDTDIAATTIMLSGHYHHRRVWPLYKDRVHIQLPALDGGSTHYENASGESSPAGIWTAVIKDGGGLDYERLLTTTL